jgi:outer membrane protein assembly factor BamB
VRLRLFLARGLGLAVAVTIFAGCGSHTAGGTSHAGSSAAPTSAVQASGLPSSDSPTFNYDASRSGVGPASGITTANLHTLSPRVVRIDGIADSAPVQLHSVRVRGRRRDVAVVSTSYGHTIAFDPGTGAVLWEFRAAGVHPGSSQVTTASPVADPDRRFVYAAAPDGVIYKLSLATGSRAWSRRITFDPVHEKIASALGVTGRYVVAVTGGYFGDVPPYDGHVVLLGRGSGRIAHVWNTECSGHHRLIAASSCGATNTHGDSAIWGRGGAVIEPGSHRILVSTGNGPFDGHSSWGDSVLELTPSASRLLHNWTPVNQAQLSAGDTDLGSAAPAVLPVYRGYHLAVQGGKDGKLHLLNLRRLNGTRGRAGPRLGGQLSQSSSPGGGPVLTQPVVWRSGGRVWLIVADDSGTAAYTLTGRRPRLRVAWSDQRSGTSPVLSGGLLYVYDEQAGELVVRSPRSGALLRALPAARGHWNSPIVASGRIILPTGNYHSGGGGSSIYVWHLPGR